MDRILVVDDDALILQALTRILTSEGYEVVAHSDPLKALEERDFAVVITDFMMPNLNGVELLGEIRKTHPFAVRLMLTAAADFRVASEAVNRGEVYRILAKPWTLSELSTCVRQAIEQFHLIDENRHLTAELSRKNGELLAVNQDLERLVVERTNGLLDGMISALDYRDTETQWHSRRVSLYSRRIAEAAEVKGAELDVIEQGALLHDIGKIGVRDSILLKPGPLTPEEWTEMKLHPEIGYRILARMPYLYEASLIVYQHQERWDGKGYPQQLSDKSIVLGARIFAIADTMDAITSDRPYRKGRPFAVAKEEIHRCSGTQFDPELVEAFLRVSEEDWAGIRQRVEGLEQQELKRWDGKELIPPAKLATAQSN